MKILYLLIGSLLQINTLTGHMLMKLPFSRGYKNNPSYPAIDYDLNAPLPSLIMCKGKPPGNVVQTWQAGQTITVQFEGSAKHGGGICQFSLSYDNDKTFVVIQEIIGPCPQEGFDWPVKLPFNLPSCERCTFAWTWINSIGNRELYMNCADIRIIGSGPGKISGRPLLIGNMPGYPIIQPRIHPGGGPDSPGTLINNFPVQASFIRFLASLTFIIILIIAPSTKLFNVLLNFLKIFGFSLKTWSFLRNSAIVLLLINAVWEGFLVVREFMKRLFVHKKDAEADKKVSQQPKTSPFFDSPLKDSYANTSTSIKENAKMPWGSPLKFSTPSPKLSERVVSPLNIVSSVNLSTIVSPSKGVGIGSTCSLALDEYLNRPSKDYSQTSFLKEAKKENIAGINTSGIDYLKNDLLKKPMKIVAEREILSPEMSLQFCNLSSDLEIYVENVRNWFTRKIIVPLSKQILLVDSQLETWGLSHLSSKIPANNDSMVAKSMNAELMSSHFCLSAPTGSNDPKIRNITDLYRSRPNDPIVLNRLKIEKYLGIAVTPIHRNILIKKIAALADGLFLGSYHPMTSILTSSKTAEKLTTDPFDDTQILLHLFCTFMDDNLPSENANDSHPFTSNYFVKLGEKVSDRRDTIQLQQISLVPVVLRVITENKILQAHQGHNNLFEAILLMVDYAHRKRRGYLGIGNLDSIKIDLISILRK